jgi:hypothetical protein
MYLGMVGFTKKERGVMLSGTLPQRDGAVTRRCRLVAALRRPGTVSRAEANHRYNTSEKGRERYRRQSSK